MNVQKNINPVDKNSREYLTKQVAGGRYALLLILIFTVVNLAMVLLDTGRYFLFSASVPYYLTMLGMGMDNGFVDAAWNRIDTYTITALAISAVILALYLVCWLLSKKRAGWLTAALVLFCLDTAALLVFAWLLYDSMLTILLDLLLHVWAIWQIAYAVRCSGKLKKLPPEGTPETPTYYGTTPDIE